MVLFWKLVEKSKDCDAYLKIANTPNEPENLRIGRVYAAFFITGRFHTPIPARSLSFTVDSAERRPRDSVVSVCASRTFFHPYGPLRLTRIAC